MKKYKFAAILVLCAFLSGGLTLKSYAQDGGTGMSAQTDKIHYINVNPESLSDAILIESDDRYLLVDTSNPDLSTGGAQAVANDTANVNEVIRYLRQIGVANLDYVVLTHNHSDHIGGVSRLCQEGLIGAGTTVFYRSSAMSEEEITYPDWENNLYLQKGLEAIASTDAKVVCLAQERITELSLTLGNFSVEFLNLDMDEDGVVDFDEENENNNSIVLKVTKGDIDTLLTGDIEQEVERKLLTQVGQVEVLKVPHHGIRTSSSYEFLKALQPETAVITAYGYSQFGAYEYLRSIGADIYTTGCCDALAIVEVVMDHGYEMQGGTVFEMTEGDGWHSWLEHSYYVENGQVFRDGWKRIGRDWYYFSEDGIMRTEDLTENGRTYSFYETGELRRH